MSKQASPSAPRSVFPAQAHNHGACLDRAMAKAKQACAARGLKLTTLRETVYREIASSHAALGAYDIIERLGRKGRRLAPISVYRILEVLGEAGLVHRLESRNAYFACLAEHENAGAALVLHCEDCGRVAEAEATQAWRAIEEITRNSRFAVAGSVLEVKGRCADCGEAAGASCAP